MVLKQWKRGSNGHIFARIAEKNFIPLIYTVKKKIHSVATTVKVLTEERAVLMILKRLVNAVVEFIRAINTKSQGTVQTVGVKCVEEDGNEDVYNMEVSGTHCFSVNGGIIVHNCMDATRYFVKTKRLMKINRTL